MKLIERLATIVAHMPEHSSITLPVEAVREWLSCEALPAKPSLDAPLVDLTVEDVAKAMGRATSTVRSWCKSGVLKGAYRLNDREWRIPHVALREFQTRQATRHPARPVLYRNDADNPDLSDWKRDRARRSA